MPFISNAQLEKTEQRTIDSLKKIIKTSKNDTLIINAYVTWDDIIYMSDPPLDYALNLKIDSICRQKLKSKLSKTETIYYRKKRSYALNGLGMNLNNQGEQAKAIQFYTESLKIAEELGLKSSTGAILMNMAVLYKDQENYTQSLIHLKRCLSIFTSIKHKLGIANSLNNLGSIYNALGKYPLAIDHLNKSIQLYRELGDDVGISFTLNNLGLIYSDQGDSLIQIGSAKLGRDYYLKAINYFEESKTIEEKTGNKQGIAASLVNLSNVYVKLKNENKALELGQLALKLAQEVNAAIETDEAAELLYNLYKRKGEYKKSMEMFELHIATRDSIQSEENQKEVIRQEYKYAYEKQAAADSVKNLEEKKVKDAFIAQQKAELKAKRNQQFMLFGGLALVVIFAGFIFNRFRVTNKQKGIIEHQKAEVEEKNKEITDSINYAKRIQTAILPPSKLITELLPQSFVLYKPKDIVAGDFYWLEKKGETILFAACDCTGHGVPGAMVSVICNNGLNRSVREYNLTDPGKILDKTREIVIQEFEKSEEEVKDGMDVSLLAFNGNAVKWSGANNPLWLIRNGELIEYKANKQPIGKYADPKPFTTHDIAIQKGDSLYIFTDGLQDQFGGEKGKKFKAAKLKELLLSIQNKSMNEQIQIIEEAFEKWKGNLEQNDDVCLIGLRT